MGNIRVITPGPLPAKYERRGRLLGERLLAQPGALGTLNSVFDGFIIQCMKDGGRVKVTFIAPPGRIVGFNNPTLNDAGTAVVAQSPPGQPYLGLIASDKNRMGPATSVITTFNQSATSPTFAPAMAYGDPLPENAQLYYSGSHPAEFAGGVVFPAMYARDPFISTVGARNPMWAVWDVRWAGAGGSMSLSMSESYLESVTDGFNLGHGPLAGFYMGARLPVGFVANKKLYGAVQVISEPLGPAGKLLVFCAEMVDGVQQMHWQFVVDPADFAGLQPMTAADGSWYRSSVDLPSVIAWVDEGQVDRCVVTCRIRTEKLISPGGSDPHIRLVTGQVMVEFAGGVPTVTCDFYDAIAGVDAGFTVPSNTKAYLQIYPDNLFLGAEGLIRHRRMRVYARPASDAGVSSDTGLPIHADIAYYRTQSAGGTFTQTQSVLGYGVEHLNAGDIGYAGEANGDTVLGFATPVAVGELWNWGLTNGTKALTMDRITLNGLVANLGEFPPSLRVSTYQQEVKDEDGNVVVNMAQLVSIQDGGPQLAVRKGRAAPIVFLPVPSYSNFGLFYLASPLDTPRYGRLFG